MRRVLLGRPAWVVCLLVLLLSLPACGPKRKPAFKASGKLLIGGKGYPGVVVILHPTDGGNVRPSGSTDADGSFTLTSYDAHDGAPAGEYVATLIYEPTSSPFAGKPRGPAPKIDGKYTSTDSSPLRATIKEGPANDIPTFEVP
jgi:hypothetical protein